MRKLLLVLALLGGFSVTVEAQTQQPAVSDTVRHPCRYRAESRQFDFWAGRWNVHGPKGRQIGTNEINVILEKCVLFENWSSALGNTGKSFSFFDPARSTWRQLWVDDAGGITDYEGGWKDGTMDMRAKGLGPNGKEQLLRMRYFPVSRDSVRQLIETSDDEGRTWQTSFDGMYVRAR